MELEGAAAHATTPVGALGIKGAWLDTPTLGNPLRGAWFRGYTYVICRAISWLCCGVPLAAG